MRRPAGRVALAAGTIVAALGAAGLFVTSTGDPGPALLTTSGSGIASAVIAEPTPPVEPAVEWPAVTRALVTTKDLNVRTGPGTHYTVIGRLQPGDEIPVAGRPSDRAWLALPGIGWVAFEASWIELLVPLPDLPAIDEPLRAFEFTGPLHAIGTPSGFPIVDLIVDAATRGDREALLSRVAGNSAPSAARENAAVSADVTATDDLPVNEAEAGSAEGDPGPTGRADCSNGGRLPATLLNEHLDRMFTSEVVRRREPPPTDGALRLYGVVRGPAGDDGGDPHYVVILAFDGGEGRQIWISPAGQITHFSFGCEPTPPGVMLDVDVGEPYFWLRPPVAPPVRPISG